MPEITAEPEATFQRALDGLEAPGVVVAVCDRSKVLWHAARGVCTSDGDTCVDLSTRFALDSVTKTFTAMAILMLRDAGVLSLDEPLARAVPEASTIRYPTRDSPLITIRHLLTHTSGLPRGVREIRRALERDPNEEELLAHASSVELEYTPGTQWRYSNLGFALLGIVIKRLSGQPYVDFVKSRILAPLRLTSTSFELHEPLAVPHTTREGEGFRPRSRVPDDCYLPVSGLYASALDLVRYVGIHLNAWPPRDEPETELPLCRATMRESHRPGGFHRVGRNSKGLGWSIERDGVVGDIVHHSGGSPYGYSAFAGFEPDVGIGIIGLANTDIDLEKPLLKLLATYALALGLVQDRRR